MKVVGGSFCSDNEAPVAGPIMAALARANDGPVHSYGADPVSQRLEARLRAWFEHDRLAVFPLATGTAANALAAATLVPPYGALYCHHRAHVNTDECGAPEFFTAGAKLVGLAGEDARIDADAFATVLASAGELGVHEVKPAALSITQATEHGTVYSLEAVRRLTALARERGLGVHMDGARFANALVALDCSPAAVTWQAGVDMLSLGATKNGALAAEALVVFDPAVAEEVAFRRKRAGHLLSKQRYVSAQLEAWLEDDLWRHLALAANEGAARLSAGLADVPGVRIAHPTQINEVFVVLAKPLASGLMAAGFEFYDWPGTPDLYRLVVRWDTPAEQIDAFLTTVRALAEGRAPR